MRDNCRRLVTERSKACATTLAARGWGLPWGLGQRLDHHWSSHFWYLNSHILPLNFPQLFLCSDFLQCSNTRISKRIEGFSKVTVYLELSPSVFRGFIEKLIRISQFYAYQPFRISEIDCQSGAWLLFELILTFLLDWDSNLFIISFLSSVLGRYYLEIVQISLPPSI